MWSLEMASGDLETTYSWHMETNAGELPEVTATAGGYGYCCKLRQLLEYDGKLSFYFNC